MWTIADARWEMARTAQVFPHQDFVIVTHERDGHQVRDVHHTSGRAVVAGGSCRHCGQVGTRPCPAWLAIP